jgi:chemotaxis protein MotB
MSVQNAESPPIIIKKVSGHGGHHGGAWKVAYADFVTAMMALFIVLWLMNSSDQVKKAVAGYFKDPTGKGALLGSDEGGSGDGIGIGKDDMNKLKEKLESAMKEVPQLAGLKDQVSMTVTGEGLRIELLEKEVGTFFESGNSQPTGPGQEMLKMLAAQVGGLPNKLLIEGHTDSRPFDPRKPYSNWELSSDRANSARRLMQQSGLRGDQVTEVRGYADQHLRKPEDPNDPSNRRISVTVRYAPETSAHAEAAGAEHAAKAGGEKPATPPAKPVAGPAAKPAAAHH